MKKTAVEWLLEYCDRENWSIPNNIIQQAKAMEKEQIVIAFSEGTRMMDVNDEMSAMLNGFIYYGETYEQDKQT